jgi:hypothetical protein
MWLFLPKISYSMQKQLGVKIGKAWDFVVVLHLAFIKVKMRA